MLHWLPLEPYEERYTADWARWFPREFGKRLGSDTWYQYDGAPLTDKIEMGDVLDAFGTTHWKLTQIAMLIEMWREGAVRDGDVIFTADLWQPGIEALAYIRSITGTDVRIAGILHAGTWDPHDFTVRRGINEWAHGFEGSVFALADHAFVGSRYHKLLIEEALGRRKGLQGVPQITATGLPFYADELQQYRDDVGRDNDLIVFPHRRDPEKRPEHFEQLREYLPGHMRFRSTMDQMSVSGKEGYYRKLGRAGFAVSFAEQETFGYAMLEAAALGAIPIVPDRLSYSELFPFEARYNPHSPVLHAADRIKELMESPTMRDDLRSGLDFTYHAGAIGRMLNALDL